MLEIFHTELQSTCHLQPATLCCCWSFASDVVIIQPVTSNSKLSALYRTLTTTIVTVIPITGVTRTTRNTASSAPSP